MIEELDVPEVFASCTMSRVWDMPNMETFKIPSIAGFVQKYLMTSRVSVDPFARNNRWATHTNDMNPNTAADYHVDAEEFCKMLHVDGVRCDLGIVDPPYGTRQIVECYGGMGLDEATMQSVKARKPTQNVSWSNVKTALSKILTDDAVVLTFGWNSAGMGKKRGFEIIEILLVCHGGGRNDTICMAERKRPNLQRELI